jgi:hypothetical protein
VCRAVDADDNFARRPRAVLLCAEGCRKVAQLEAEGDNGAQLSLIDESGQFPELAAVGPDDEIHSAHVAAPVLA